MHYSYTIVFFLLIFYRFVSMVWSFSIYDVPSLERNGASSMTSLDWRIWRDIRLVNKWMISPPPPDTESLWAQKINMNYCKSELPHWPIDLPFYFSFFFFFPLGYSPFSHNEEGFFLFFFGCSLFSFDTALIYLVRFLTFHEGSDCDDTTFCYVLSFPPLSRLHM